MKKFVHILLLSLFSTLGFAQHTLTLNQVQEFFYPEFDLKAFEIELEPNERTKLLKQLCLLGNHCDYCIDEGDVEGELFQEYLESHQKSIHFVDLDEDGDTDILFNGKECGGFEVGMVEFYENQSDSLIRRFKIEGRLINLDVKNRTFAIHDYPCCAQQSNYVVEYNYGNELFDLRFVKASLFLGRSGLLGGPFFPDSTNLNESFTTQQETALRWSPNTTDNDPSETCSINDGNVIARYPKGVIGTILYRNKDGWCFVKMSYHSNAENPCDSNRVANLPEDLLQIYGWIKR